MIDERTGRPFGDHGTAVQALDYALDVMEDDPALQLDFLEAWREGGAFEGWPEFYEWLRAREAPRADDDAPGIGRVELGAGEEEDQSAQGRDQIA